MVFPVLQGGLLIAESPGKPHAVLKSEKGSISEKEEKIYSKRLKR